MTDQKRTFLFFGRDSPPVRENPTESTAGDGTLRTQHTEPHRPHSTVVVVSVIIVLALVCVRTLTPGQCYRTVSVSGGGPS